MQTIMDVFLNKKLYNMWIFYSIKKLWAPTDEKKKREHVVGNWMKMLKSPLTSPFITDDYK